VTGVIKTFNLFYYRKSALVVRVVFRVGNRTSFIRELGRGGTWTAEADHFTQPTTPVRYVKRSTGRRKPDLLLQVAVGMC